MRWKRYFLLSQESGQKEFQEGDEKKAGEPSFWCVLEDDNKPRGDFRSRHTLRSTTGFTTPHRHCPTTGQLRTNVWEGKGKGRMGRVQPLLGIAYNCLLGNG